MKTATINLSVLKAAAMAASSEQTRYYLQGVLVEIDADAVRYVATDGHILFAATRNVNEPNTLTGAWIIPAEAIKAIKLPRSSRHFDLATLYSDGVFGSEPNQLSLVLKFGEASYGFRPIDGTFPDWRRVLPRVTTGSINDIDHTGADKGPVGYEPDSLGALWRISKALDLGDKPSISYNGAGPALVLFPRSDDNDTFAVIMPTRFAKPSQQLPEWARVKSGESRVAKAA